MLESHHRSTRSLAGRFCGRVMDFHLTDAEIRHDGFASVQRVISRWHRSTQVLEDFGPVRPFRTSAISEQRIFRPCSIFSR